MIKQGMNILKENAKKRLDFNPELKQINFLDRRVYKRDEGIYYPSVTTILPPSTICLEVITFGVKVAVYLFKTAIINSR